MQNKKQPNKQNGNNKQTNKQNGNNKSVTKLVPKIKGHVDKESELQQRKILEILPMLQSDIWKVLKIERRQCSRMLDKMTKLRLIKKSKVKGSFMVEVMDAGKPIVEKNFSALLSGCGRISPCVGCAQECNPALCTQIDSWIKEDVNI